MGVMSMGVAESSQPRDCTIVQRAELRLAASLRSSIGCNRIDRWPAVKQQAVGLPVCLHYLSPALAGGARDGVCFCRCSSCAGKADNAAR